MDCRSGQYLRLRPKRFAPVISVLLTLCIILSGCNSKDLLQPGRADIAGANLYLVSEPITLAMDLKLMSPSGTVLYYNSSVTAYDNVAVWNGVAKVYYGGMYFSQTCNTVCEDIGSRKLWRETWAASDTQSPIPLLKEWLGKVEKGGAYLTRPVVPAEESEDLSSFTDTAYRISWTETAPEWKALCDAHPDTLFGGDELLTRFDAVELTMYIGTDDLMIDVIHLTAEGEDDGWISFTVIPTTAKSQPDVSYSGEIKQNVLLREEWEIIYSYITGTDAEQA